MKEYGISLITLIITLIVIIFLTVIILFSGLDTADDAVFSKYLSDIDTVSLAVLNSYSELKAKHSVNGEHRTDEQIYIEIAIGADPGQYAMMRTESVCICIGNIVPTSSGCINILGWRKSDFNDNSISYHSVVVPSNDTEFLESLSSSEIDILEEANISIGEKLAENINMLKISNLPIVRERDDGWYITKNGIVFNTTGFLYKNRIYFNENYYTKDTSLSPIHSQSRANIIANYINGTGNKSGYEIKF